VCVIVGHGLCCGPSRTSVDHVRSFAPPSPQWSFDINLSFRPLELRVYLCLCVRVCARSLLQVGVSQSWFHVPLCSTILLLGRCRASTYSSSAPSGFFSATCVETKASIAWPFTADHALTVLESLGSSGWRSGYLGRQPTRCLF
jgi:hypothetical protein